VLARRLALLAIVALAAWLRFTGLAHGRLEGFDC
jgi:hypothetical protein